MATSSDQSLRDFMKMVEALPLDDIVDIPCMINPKFNPVLMRKSLESKINAEETILLCSLGVQRVSNIEKSTQLADLERRLNLQKKAMRDHEAVTLNRIMKCFPEITIDLVHKQDLPKVVPYQELKRIHPEFPIVATNEVAAAILPSALTEDETCLALGLIVVSSLKTSEKTRRDKQWNDMPQHVKSRNALYYIVQSYKSRVLSEQERCNLAVKYGVVRSDGGLSQAWVEAGAAAKEWLNFQCELNVGQAGFRLVR